MNKGLSIVYRLMLSAAMVLTVLGSTTSTANGVGTLNRNNLNQTAWDVSYPHRPSSLVDGATAPLSPSAATEAEPTAEATDTAVPAESLAPDLGDDAAQVTAIRAAAAFANSLALDGSGDFVRIPHDDALNDYSYLAIEAWVRRASDDRCETIVSKGRQNDYWLGFCNRTLSFYIGGAYYEGNTPVPADVWTHVAVVAMPYTLNPSVRFYINGLSDGSAFIGEVPSKGSLPIFIGANPELDDRRYFSGNIAEVRLWSTNRLSSLILHNMHIALEEPLPNLIANWHLTDDYRDNIGGYDGTPNGNASLDGPQAPPRPAVVPIDENFSTLPEVRSDAATVYVPARNQALLIGGSYTSDVYALDAGAGATTALTPLPRSLSYASAAYVPAYDTAYVFGGFVNYPCPVYAIQPDVGYTRTLSATIGTGLNRGVAVYHSGLDKVYVIGGQTYVVSYVARDSILVFDPISETITESMSLRLPQARYDMAAAYSSVTDRVYIFGGRDTTTAATDTIYEMAVGPDGESGSVTTMTLSLPQPSYGLSAVEDPRTHLIYLLGGTDVDRVLVFDPATGELWQTPIEVEERTYAGAIYSPRNRHALLIGGRNATSVSQDTIWRIPLGDGPAVSLGHWDFPSLPPSGDVTAIDGDESRVLIGTDSDGVWRYDEDRDGLHYTPAALGSANGNVHDVHYDAENEWVWIATNDAGASLFDGSSDILTPLRTYDNSELGTNTILAVDVKPYAYSIDGSAFFGTYAQGLRWQSSAGGGWSWETNFAGNFVGSIAHRASGDLWIGSDGYLKRLVYNQTTGAATETTHGLPCGYAIADLVFGQNDDWWVAAREGEMTPGGVCFIPGATTPGTGTPMEPQDPIGSRAGDIDLDADGRVWVALEDDNRGQSGGLVAWETENSSPSLLRTEEYNWDDGPVSGNISDTYGTIPAWESGVTAVGAVDEKVWAGTSYQKLVTLAQRWQQLQESNELYNRPVRRLWTARGRLFLASTTSLYVLMPDGRSWDNRLNVPTYAVLGDSRGRIWVGTGDGVRRYTAIGWDMLTGTAGTAPTGVVYALAEDAQGRIWIGGAGGLTLFDRERFVATFTAANSDLPANTIKALLVDRENRLWVGTTAGLARLDNDDSPWVTYTTASGLAGNNIHDLNQRGDEFIVVTTDGGLSYYYEPPWDDFWSPYLPFDTIDAPLTVDELGRLWAGSAVSTADGWQSYYWTNSGLCDSAVSDNAADGAGRVWFSHWPEEGVSVRGAFLPPLANAVPVISGIQPDHGTSGDTIVINGSGFGDNPSDVSVTIGGTSAEVRNVSPGTISVLLNDENVSGDVSVSVDGRRTTFSGGGGEPAFCAIPQVRELSPTGGNAGAMINIWGSNFDPAAQVSIFVSGVHDESHDSTYRNPTHLSFIVQPLDGSGYVRVRNGCGDVVTSTQEFRHIGLWLHPDQVILNQGIPSYPLVAGKPTMIQHYLRHTAEAPRDTDHLEVGTVEVTFTNSDTGASRSYSIPYSGTFTTTLDAPPEAWLQDTSTSLNVTLTPLPVYDDVSDMLPDGGADLVMTTTLKTYGLVVAQASRTVHFEPQLTMQVLLVPIMPITYTQSQLWDMRFRINSDLYELERRILPAGRMQFYWSDLVVTRDDRADLGDFQELWDTGIVMQSFRTSFNRGYRLGGPGSPLPSAQAQIAFGVVHEDVFDDSSGIAGMGLWGDLTVAAAAGAGFLEDVCGFFGNFVDIFTDEPECEFDVPVYVGWAYGGPDNDDVSELIGHEMGHILGLVKPGMANHSPMDLEADTIEELIQEIVDWIGDPAVNVTHSMVDELDNGFCQTGTPTYTWDLSLYMQPGVVGRGPIVNPLTGEQLYPQDNGDPNTTRAKAIMSYACGMEDENVFFEPVDLDNMDLQLGVWDMSDLTEILPRASAAYTAPAAPKSQASPVFRESRARTIPGERLFISGVVSRTMPGGRLETVKAVGEDSPLSLGFDRGYWLVQLDGSDGELSRIGVYPLFNATASNGTTIVTDTGAFAATVLRQEGVARLELRQGDTVLDTFSAGSAPPAVTVTSPTGGVYSSGTIPVTWTANDDDGDPLSITIEYSATGSIGWIPVAFSSDSGTAQMPVYQLAGSGTVQVPVYQLAGSDEAHFRVVASDGFNSGSATSVAFSVADQPPRPYIGHPTAGSTFSEGERVILSGGAGDNLDRSVAGANLSWSSDRDGDLGTGSELGVFLSVGDHTLTLEAANSAGLTATTNVTLTVVGDYDYDGISDSEEMTDGLNPLTQRDAYSDDDGDGLPLIMERLRGLDPNDPDSDGDGRNDAEEIVDGTNPLATDDPLPPDQLEVFPERLGFKGDLSLDTPMPQRQVQVVSREPAIWTMTSDVTWLAATVISGTTPAGSTIVVKAFDLEEGVHTGNLIFTSVSLGSVVTVPVTATITNTAAYFDTNSDNCVNVGDVQDVAGRIPSDNGQEGYSYRRDVDRDGDVDTADALLMAQRWTTERDICSTSYPTATSVVRVNAPASVAVGTVFTASILVDNPQDLGGFEFDLAFDPTVLQVQGAALDDLLGSTGRTAGDLGPTIDNTAGTIAFGGYTHGEPAGVSSDGELAQITFRATAPGNSALDIQNPLLADPSGDLTMAVDRDASVRAREGYEIFLPLVLRDFS